MNRLSAVQAASLVCIFLAMGCSGSGNPVTPSHDSGLSSVLQSQNHSSAPATQTQLWGYYTVSIDIDSGTVEAVCDRSLMYTANVTNFLNSNPLSMSFKINQIIPNPSYTDIDIDVGITHPFPGMPQYNGYDVRGIFMGDGSATLESIDLDYPVQGIDQLMLHDPETGPGDPIGGGPDGYTRWFNRTEFLGAGLPLFKYTPGNLASPGFNGTATLCPYKYFANSLDTNDNLWNWITSNSDLDGIFSSGSKNERNYYLRFPNSKGVIYGYAVIANWEGTEPEFHPSNAIESVASNVDDQSSLYFVDSSNKGGQIKLDISIFDWHSVIEGGTMLDYAIRLESPVLTNPYVFNATEMTPIGGNDIYSTYHVEIVPDNLTQSGMSEYWLIVDYPGYDYSNDFGVPNLAQDDTLAAYFRYDLPVSNSPTNQDPVCSLELDENSLEGWDVTGAYIRFDASGSYDPDGGDLTYEWDFDNDGLFDENPDDFYTGDPFGPIHNYMGDGIATVRLTDPDGGVSQCSIDVFPVLYPSKNIPLKSGLIPYDIATDPADGDLMVIYNDGAMWKREIGDWYQDGTDVYFADLADGFQDPTGLEYMDIAGNSLVCLTGQDDTNGFNRIAYFYGDGSSNGCGIFVGSSSNIFDAWAFTAETPTHANYAGDARGRNADYNNMYYQELEWFVPPDYCGGAHFASNSFAYGGNTFGPGVIYWPYIVACESVSDAPKAWFLEDADDYYASRWSVVGDATYNSLVYDNAYFGNGSQTDSDNGWNESLDISRNADDDIFVLDRLSNGDPRIKMWTVDGNTTTSEGGFGDSTSISSDPLRLEGSDVSVEWFGSYLFVLHGNSGDGYMISIFFDIEYP